MLVFLIIKINKIKQSASVIVKGGVQYHVINPPPNPPPPNPLNPPQPPQTPPPPMKMVFTASPLNTIVSSGSKHWDQDNVSEQVPLWTAVSVSQHCNHTVQFCFI